VADPVTQGILLAASVAISATSAVAQGVQASKTAKYNAKVGEIKATAARADAAENERRFRRTTAQRMGALRAGRPTEGSALDIVADSAIEEELQALTIRHQGELQAAGLESTAALDRSKAGAAMAGGIAGAGSALLMGASAAAGMGSSSGANNTTSGLKTGSKMSGGGLDLG